MIQLAPTPTDFGSGPAASTQPPSRKLPEDVSGRVDRRARVAANVEPAAAGLATEPMNADEVDDLEVLGEQIATLAAHIHAASHQLLVLIAEFDERRGWEADGHRSCADWLAFRTRIERVTGA